MSCRYRITNRLLFSLIALLIGLSLGACSASKSTEALSITAYGPDSTKIGTAFNVQPDGQAAIWVTTSINLDKTASIFMDGQKLSSTVKDNLITAAVPGTFYNRTGSFPIYVSETVDGKLMNSNVVTFTVHN